MPEEQKLSALERLRKEEMARADAEVQAKVDHFKRVCLENHLRSHDRVAGEGNAPEYIEPDTLTDAEVAAVAGSLKNKEKVEQVGEGGLQDSVDVVVEYLRGNPDAAKAFKQEVG